MFLPCLGKKTNSYQRTCRSQLSWIHLDMPTAQRFHFMLMVSKQSPHSASAVHPSLWMPQLTTCSPTHSPVWTGKWKKQSLLAGAYMSTKVHVQSDSGRGKLGQDFTKFSGHRTNNPTSRVRFPLDVNESSIYQETGSRTTLLTLNISANVFF